MGLRELPWYEMAKYDMMGKKHWHPEFREMDYHIPAYLPSKFRPEGKKKKRGYSRVKKVFPPVPDTDDPPGYGYKDLEIEDIYDAAIWETNNDGKERKLSRRRKHVTEAVISRKDCSDRHHASNLKTYNDIDMNGDSYTI